MKAKFQRKIFLEAFNMVSSVVPTRSPKPILQNIKLSIGVSPEGEQFATLMGTDTEVGVRRNVDGVDVYDDGEVILPTERMSQILRTSIDEFLSIESDGDKLIIQGSRSKFNLPNEDASLFPDVPDFTGEDYMVIVDSDLKRLVKRTSFATDIDSSRYALGGVLAERYEDKMTFVGTDGRRLAMATVPAERIGEDNASQVVVPMKVLKLIDKALTGNGDQVHVGFVKNASVMIRSSNTVIYSRLVEGRYPKYQGAFPKSKIHTIELNVASFKSAVEQASIITDKESKGVTFTFSENGVELTSIAADVGQSKIDLPLLGAFSGDEISVVMDPDYVIEALRSLELDTPLAVDLIDSKQPVVFRSGDSYTYLVMPIVREK